MKSKVVFIPEKVVFPTLPSGGFTGEPAAAAVRGARRCEIVSSVYRQSAAGVLLEAQCLVYAVEYVRVGRGR